MKREGPFVGEYVLGFPIKIGSHTEFFLQFTIYPAKMADALKDRLNDALSRFTKEGGTKEQLMRDDFHHVLMQLCRQEESAPSEQGSEDIEWANEMEKKQRLSLRKVCLTKDILNHLSPGRSAFGNRIVLKKRRSSRKQKPLQLLWSILSIRSPNRKNRYPRRSLQKNTASALRPYRIVLKILKPSCRTNWIIILSLCLLKAKAAKPFGEPEGFCV